MLIKCKATLVTINAWTLLVLPEDASSKLPSRGIVMVKGTINGAPLHSALEPDGKGSHWLEIDKTISKAAKANVGDTVTLEIEATKEWPEPQIPADLKKALATTPQAQASWLDTTPMARWDWIRWIRSTKNLETRKKRIEVALSKLKAGMKRPCCFNRSMCTEPSVSNNGVLLEPNQ